MGILIFQCHLLHELQIPNVPYNSAKSVLLLRQASCHPPSEIAYFFSLRTGSISRRKISTVFGPTPLNSCKRSDNSSTVLACRKSAPNVPYFSLSALDTSSSFVAVEKS